MAQREHVYLVPPAVFSPSILSVVAIVLGLAVSRWALAMLPFIWLGALCSAPNLNLANGCLAYLAMIAGWLIAEFFEPRGIVILVGAASGFYADALEKHLRMRLVPDKGAAQFPESGNGEV